MRRGESFRPMHGSGPFPRGFGDRNRGVERPQTVNKVFQQYRGAQQNPPGYGEGSTVPFNIDEAPYGNHY